MKHPIDYAILFCKVWIWGLAAILVIDVVQLGFIVAHIIERHS